MIARTQTVAFHGVSVQPVDVEVQIAKGMVAFTIVGLPDKAVAESKERVRAALHALGLSMPTKRVTVNLAPGDLAKEGSHYDLPIALALLAAMEVIPAGEIHKALILGELALDGSLRKIQGVLAAALHASAHDYRLICPAACGAEAAWAGDHFDILAPHHLLPLINHMKGEQRLSRPRAVLSDDLDAMPNMPDLESVKGQETAKRALEIAAAGGHNLMLSGPPGAGKSLMASCLNSILPPLSPKEALEVSIIHSIAGSLPDSGLMRHRPYRAPHHSASMPALVGGGNRVKPGEISLAHYGVLFLDELPEFTRTTLESLRQPIETGQVTVARVNQHVTYPAQFQLIAAMNPCQCGYFGEAEEQCNKAPKCAQDYQSRLSGPLLDRFDMHIGVRPVSVTSLHTIQKGESSKIVRARVIAARDLQKARFDSVIQNHSITQPVNARLQGEALDKIAIMSEEASALLVKATEKLKLSARSYHRMLRVGRTIADLAGSERIERPHIAEAISYRRLGV